MSSFKASFAAMEWQQIRPDVRQEIQGSRQVRLVELETGDGAEHWCETGHIDYVLRGALSMEEPRLLRFVGFPAVLILLALSSACTPETATESAPLIGAWRSSLEVESGAFAEITDLQFMYAFNAGGTLTESSNYDGAPPVPPAYGVWQMIGPRVFEARYEFFSTAPSEGDAFLKGAGWPPSGRGVFTERIEVSADAQTFTSTIRYELFGKRGEPLEGGGTARGEGVRIGL